MGQMSHLDQMHQSDFRPGDWLCPICQAHNYSLRTECIRCRTPKDPGMGMYQPNPYGYMPPVAPPPPMGGLSGDWMCAQCRGINRPQRTECYMCGALRYNRRGGPVGPPLMKKEVREGDWYCSGCGNFNFSFRKTCQKCDQPMESASKIVAASDHRSSRSQTGRPGDWKCPLCRAYNYAFRDTCYRCSGNKPEGEGETE
ncbi:hypothetical protein BLNAU_16127 [Blattamonas nauphoetae]|uniref:RanBP2-type domain-containing protein n=1 Tax=Blattamonas nauphoetae TaxID=2049346 RepID=A0ABQ9XDG6_9EUKA|nr:hypothetical protein BLNAU_16127 [Blattamonas nauphoetae]